jgi:hypothetical protein
MQSYHGSSSVERSSTNNDDNNNIEDHDDMNPDKTNDAYLCNRKKDACSILIAMNLVGTMSH